MFLYLFQNKNDYITVISVDFDGSPSDERIIEKKSLENVSVFPSINSPNVLVIKPSVDMEGNTIPVSVKEPITLYFEEPLMDIFKNFKKEEDWVNFFHTHHIDNEVGGAPKKYLVQ